MKQLYPPIDPFAVHEFPVTDGHVLFVEECGNPLGLPVLFLHGGPGSGCKPHQRQFFDPRRYRVILVDQRGAGRSTPAGALEHNTTRHLLADLELLRHHLGVDRWLLFGGSWGATLALLYAQSHPQCVLGLVLRGSFLARERDLHWFLGGGLERIYPDEWERLRDALPASGGGDLLRALYEGLLSGDPAVQQRVAAAWVRWGTIVTLGSDADPALLAAAPSADELRQAVIEAHYAVHRYFIAENQILGDCPRIAHLPISIIHGRRDLVCPVEAGYTLHRHLAGSEWRVLADAGHVAQGEEMIDALVTAADRMADRLADSRQ